MSGLPPPLRVSIPGVLLFLGVVLLATSVHFELEASDQRAEAAVIERAQLLSLVLSAQIEKSYRERSTLDARAIVLHASADRALQLAILFDEQGNALESAPLGTAGQPITKTSFAEDIGLLHEMRDSSAVGLQVARHGGYVNTYVPVRLASAGEDLVPTGTGALAMKLDLRPTLSEGRVRVARRAIGLAVVLASFCMFLWLFFKLSLLRRVQALIATTTKFAAGDLAARTDIRGSDELVHLAMAFDRMAEAISVNRAALVEAERHSSFLAEVSQGLATVFDASEPLHALARLAVPLVGDACLVYVSDDAEFAVAHLDPKLDKLLRRHASSPIGGVLAKALESGEPQLSPSSGALLGDALGAVWPEGPQGADLAAEGSYLAMPLRARGRTLGVIAFVARDKHRYETPQLRALAGEMTERAALHIDNSRLYRQAQKAVRMRDEFLMVASHELRTPCTSLRMAVELLHRGLPSAPAQKMLDVADRESRVLTTLVERLLDVSRIADARLDIVLEPVDLTTTVREATADVAISLKDSGGSTLVMESGEAVVGCWDRKRIEQMVKSLVVNAIKYGRGRPIHVRVERAADMAKLTVEDQGSGIAPERQATIFERFEREVSLRHYGGFGLGLFVVRRIVEALGGTIRLTSEVGVGSTFVVELPLVGPHADAVT